jgi:pantoate--beta-alanine ligase
LALSSRNAYLNDEERFAAPALYRALQRAKVLYKDGERNAARIAGVVRATIESEPRARIDYISITDADTLEKLDKLDDRTVLIAVAAQFGKTRLIDNIVLNRKKDGTKA